MIPVIVLTLIAVTFVVFLGFQVWRRYSVPAGPALAGQLIPIDLDAFQNLTDPEEEAFLKSHLAAVDFRGVQRSRIRAARLYVAALSGNASVLVAVGQSVRDHADPEVAASGAEIVQRAMRLKVWCMLSELRLTAALAFPTMLSPSNALASHYLTVTYMASSLPSKLAA